MENSSKELQPHAVMKMLSVVILLLLPITVLAQQQQGTACMFNAPSGATFAGINFGHVGWSFQNGTSPTWYFGATENGNSNITVPAGGDTETWMSQGLDSDMFAAFKNAGYFHSAGYYTAYRCISVFTTIDVNSALVMQATTATNGYDVLNNNCLTKSVAIVSAYADVGLWDDGSDESPNNYFNNLNLAGWGPAQSL